MKMCQHVTWNFFAHIIIATYYPWTHSVIITITIRDIFSPLDKAQARPSSSSGWRGEGKFTELVIPSSINKPPMVSRSNVVFTTPRLITYLSYFHNSQRCSRRTLEPPRHYIISKTLHTFTSPRSLCNHSCSWQPTQHRISMTACNSMCVDLSCCSLQMVGPISSGEKAQTQ